MTHDEVYRDDNPDPRPLQWRNPITGEIGNIPVPKIKEVGSDVRIANALERIARTLEGIYKHGI